MLGQENAWVCDNCVNKENIKGAKEFAKFMAFFALTMGITGIIISIAGYLDMNSVVFMLILPILLIGLVGSMYKRFSPKSITGKGHEIAVDLKSQEIKKLHGQSVGFFNSSEYSKIIKAGGTESSLVPQRSE